MYISNRTGIFSEVNIDENCVVISVDKENDPRFLPAAEAADTMLFLSRSDCIGPVLLNVTADRDGL